MGTRLVVCRREEVERMVVHKEEGGRASQRVAEDDGAHPIQ